MLNIVKLKGTITKKSPLISTSRGEMVKCTIVVDRSDRSGKADLIPCIAFSSSARELCANFRKGDEVKLKGQLRMDNWTSSMGTEHFRAAVLITQVSPAVTKEQETKENGSAEPSLSSQPVSDFQRYIIYAKNMARQTVMVYLARILYNAA